jgi:hypothetical protein
MRALEREAAAKETRVCPTARASSVLLRSDAVRITSRAFSDEV